MHIAILGVGNMGRAILDGLKRSVKDISLTAFDVVPKALSELPAGVNAVPVSTWFVNTPPDAVIIAVKPADLPKACSQIMGAQQAVHAPAPLYISIAAGVSIDTIRTSTSPSSRICRVMPNTPAKVGMGMSAYACSETCTENDVAIVKQIFDACGRSVAVPEKLLHAVTGLSGSGPAYAFLFIEALIEGGVTAGLPLSVARECAVQTVLGAAAMVQQSTEHTGALKAAVMSPGGTTAAGLRALEKGAFKSSVIDAVAAATNRSAELG